MTIEERVTQLKELSPRVQDMILNAIKGAGDRAVQRAADLTPPVGGDMSGTNTRSGELKQHWESDSDTTPKKLGDTYTVLLANDKDYASYVNDGHRMDRHFVPGLYINPYSGLMEYDPSAQVGIVVGTKTSYVPGLYMVERAKDTFHWVLEDKLDKVTEVLK